MGEVFTRELTECKLVVTQTNRPFQQTAIATLVNTRQDRGEHSVELNATRLAGGVYFYRLEAGGVVAVKRMVVLK